MERTGDEYETGCLYVAQNLCTLPIENLQAAYVCEYLRLDVFAMSVGGTEMTIGMILGALILLAGLSAVFAIRELYLLTGILSIALFLLMNRSKK